MLVPLLFGFGRDAMTSVLCLLQQINQELTLGVSSQQIILEILPHCFELQSYFLLLILELVPGYW